MTNVLEFLENNHSSNYLIDKNRKITYDELLINSKKIGTYLGKIIRKNSPVPIYMEKGTKTLEVFMGSIYAGGFWTLLNVGLPDNRIKQIMEVLDTDYIVTDYDNFEKIKSIFEDKQIILYDDMIKEKIDDKRLQKIRKASIDLDPVYANFTSGSTGVPKGVLVSHRCVIDFINTFTKTFKIKKNDVIGNQAPFDFDVSIKDIFSALKMGSTLVIIPKELFSSPAKLLDFIDDNHVTTLIWAVSALCLVSTFHGLDYKTPKNIKKILFSGEVMPIKHLKYWMNHLKRATFVNLYGPTEITCNCTYHIIDRKRDYDLIPIGDSFVNREVFLLKNNKLVSEDDVKGEICVRASTLALGYYKDSVQTSKSFVQNPLNDAYIDMIYKTGDLGYYHSGELYFGGRVDFQVKYLGHRVELEEVDKAIEDIDEIVRSITLFQEEKSKLINFYIGNIDSKTLHQKLRNDLPIFMVPTKYIQLEEFPLSKNGKVDRKKLKEMIK